jgi:pimeloyl-ACP methyl ester carboxylesterase
MSPRINDLRILMLPGKGHWIQSEAGEEVSAALREFAG